MNRVQPTKEELQKMNQEMVACAKALKDSNPDSKDREKLETAFRRGRNKVHLATHPTKLVNKFSQTEVDALTKFRDELFLYAPWLIGSTVYQDGRKSLDPRMVAGGYVLFIVMTRLPRGMVSTKWLANQPKEEREAIRAAFKQAMT